MRRSMLVFLLGCSLPDAVGSQTPERHATLVATNTSHKTHAHENSSRQTNSSAASLRVSTSKRSDKVLAVVSSARSSGLSSPSAVAAPALFPHNRGVSSGTADHAALRSLKPERPKAAKPEAKAQPGVIVAKPSRPTPEARVASEMRSTTTVSPIRTSLTWKSNASLPTGASHFLAAKSNTTHAANASAEECACEFKGECSCEASHEFMQCISRSCSGGCSCHTTQYHDACVQLSQACGDAGLSFQCGQETTTCVVNHKAGAVDVKPAVQQGSAPSSAPAATPNADGHDTGEVVYEMKPQEKVNRVVARSPEPLPTFKPAPATDPVKLFYHELQDLKEEKCALQLSVQDGLVNADNRLDELEPAIAVKMQALGHRCLDLPEMHCEKDFEEWSLPPPPCTNEQDEAEAAQAEAAASEQKSGGGTLSVGVLSSLLLGAAVSVL